MADSGPEDTTDGPDDDVDDGTDARDVDAATGDGPSTDETMTTGAGGANLRIIPPDGDSQPGVRTRRTAPRRRPAAPPTRESTRESTPEPSRERTAASSDDRGDRPPLRSLHALDMPLPAMAPGTGAGRPTGDESSDAGADDSPIIRVDSGDRSAASVDEDTETRRRRRRDRTARPRDAETEVPVTPAPADDLTEDSGAFDYDAVTEYDDDRRVSPDDDEFGDGAVEAPDDDLDGADDGAVALDDDVAEQEDVEEDVEEYVEEDVEEDDVVAVVTDRPGPALSKLRRRGDAEAPAADGGPEGGTSRPNPYVKIGVGLGFSAVAVAILVLGGRPGFAFMVATFVVWVSVEYQMALGEAVRLTELEGVPVAVGARAEQRRGVTAPIATLSPFEPASLVAIVAALAMVGFGYLFGAEAAGLVAAVAFVAAALWGLGASEKTSVLNAAMSLTSIAHVAVLGTFAMLTLRMQHGFALLIVVVLLTVVSDVAAYGFGSWIGRRKFFPSVSPNKSLEGFVASALVTVLVAAIIVALRPVLFEDVTNLTWTVGLVLGVVVAVFATLGDLAESLIKRSLGIKDMASLLPGHGGMFDRFDAALFVFPVAYLALWLTGAGSPT